MPYISVRASVALDNQKKELLKSELGRLITIIPGKTEPDLMVDIGSDLSMYMAGKSVPCAYIDLRVYTKTEEQAKKRFTKELCAMLKKELDIEIENQYVTISEFENWGYDGEYH